MNELFNSLFDALDGQMNGTYYTTASAPNVDITQTKDAYTIQMDLPGRTENDINLELDRNVLTISSANKETEEDQNEACKTEAPVTKWLLKERKAVNFSRRFTMPDDIDAENVAASFKNGVLNVVIPRKEHDAPKKIAITA